MTPTQNDRAQLIADSDRSLREASEWVTEMRALHDEAQRIADNYRIMREAAEEHLDDALEVRHEIESRWPRG